VTTLPSAAGMHSSRTYCLQIVLILVQIKCQLDATEVFIAQHVSGTTMPTAEGYVSGLQDAAASCKPDT